MRLRARACALANGLYEIKHGRRRRRQCCRRCRRCRRQDGRTIELYSCFALMAAGRRPAEHRDAKTCPI